MSRVTTGPCTVALHVSERVEDAERLHWTPATLGPMHAVEWTCPAHPVMYEFGLVGGVYRIRRTARGSVHLTPTALRREATEWWRALLAGRAR